MEQGNDRKKLKAGVIGGGAWGTALAAATARAGHAVTLWALENEVVSAINTTHENSVFLKGAPLPKNIHASSDYADLKECDFILMVCPAQFMRPVSIELKKHIPDHVPLVICSKGIEKSTGKLMSEVLTETTPNNPIAILSGPTFAIEVANNLPSAMTLASQDKAVLSLLMDALSQPLFRTYGSDDIIGAQIGGSVKNVLAIACGIVTGRKMGENARTALITRGLAEMMRFASYKGAKPKTLMGLCGMGDLVLTCSSIQSRNMSLGKALGEGQTIDEILTSRNTVSEGYHSSGILYEIAVREKIDMPIVETVYNILHKGENVGEAIEDLLNRPVGSEF